MPDFLAEIYISNAAEASRLPGLEDLLAATKEVTREGSRVDLLRLIHVPADETCFYLFSAESEERVVDAADRAGIHFDRVAEAIADPSLQFDPASEPLDQIQHPREK